MRVGSLGLIAFAIGFGIAHFAMHRKRSRLVIADAIPISPPHVQANSPAGDPLAYEEQLDKQTADQDRAGATALAALLESKDVGRRAPEFNVQDLEGNATSSSSLRGKVVLLNLWATWCGICQEEMPSLDRLYERLKNNSDFAMLSVCIDDEGDQSKISALMEKGGFHYPVMIDPSGTMGDAYGVRGVPTTYVIDRSGRIAWSVVGGFDWSNDQVVQALEKML